MGSTETGLLLSGRYRLNRVIGQGGMGVVWQARDELLERDVAVKELVWPPGLSESERETASRRAVREAQLAGRLAHLNVVRIYDILQEDGNPWIIMELLPYQSLRDIVRDEGPLPPDRAARIGLGVLAALRAAHAEGVLHRDVKPGNVLVGPDGRVVLTDFGIARVADSTTLTAGVLVGSPSYIAPERARGGESRPAGDLWGLGACLYAAVEGHPPFERNAALATLTAVVADEPEEAVHAGPLWPVISALLRKDPDARLDAAQTERMLREVADGRPAADGVRAPAPAAPARPSAPPTAPMAAEPGTTAPATETADDDDEAGAGSPAGPPEPAAERPDSGRPAAAPDPPEPAPGRPRQSRRRGLMLAALAVAAALAAGATALTLALTGSPSRTGAASGAGSHSATRAASPASASPSVAKTPSAAAPSGAATSASPPASPGPTTSPSGGYGALPAGYYRFTNSTGFSIGVPRGWQISHVGHYVYISDPSDANVYLLIDQSDSPKPNPLLDWEQQAANRAGSYPDYHLIRLQSVSYPQAEKAADWEFTYDRSGVPVHILNRNVLANADHAYALYWSTPESDWNADYHYFTALADTFRPAPGPPMG